VVRPVGALLALLAIGVLAFYLVWRPAPPVEPTRGAPTASRVTTPVPSATRNALVSLTFSEEDLTKAAASYMPMTVSGITVSDPLVRLTPGRLTLTATGRAFFISGPILVVASPVVSGGRVIARIESATLAGIALPDSAKQDIADTFAQALARSIPANARVTSVSVGTGTLTVEAVVS
jgi:hypothetical protein